MQKGTIKKIKVMGGIWLNKALSGPYTVQLGLINVCNYRCIMCNVFSPLIKKPDDDQTKNAIMDFDVALNLVKDLSYLGTRKINMSGFGEPLLFPKIIDITKFIKSKGIELFITTNGYMLKRQMIDSLVECGTDGFYVSLNCARAGTYPRIHTGRKEEDFEQIVSNLRYLKEKASSENKKVSVSVSFVLMKINYEEIEDFFTLANYIGADEIMFRQLGVGCIEQEENLALSREEIKELRLATEKVKDSNLKNNLGDILQSLGEKSGKKKTGCFAGFIGGTLITGDGAVFACCACSSPIGNINENSFINIWNSERYILFRDQGRDMWKEGKGYPQGCFCDTCPTYSVNLKIQTMLYPWR